MDACACADACVPSSWTPQEGSGAAGVLSAAWCAFTGIDWGNCSPRAVSRHTCAVTNSPTSGLCTTAYGYSNECCVRWAGSGGGGNSSSWRVRPELTASGRTATQQALGRVNWGVPAHCDCAAYGQLLAQAGGQEPRYLCTCSPDSHSCVPGPTLWALLPVPPALGVAAAVAVLPVAVLCLQLHKRALPPLVACSLALSAAALFATVAHMGTTPWASFGYLVAHIVVLATPALPYGLAVVLPSALSFGTWGGGAVWTMFRTECFSILSLPRARRQCLQRRDECLLEVASFREDYDAACAASRSHCDTAAAALRFYASVASLLCDTLLVLLLSFWTRVGAFLVVGVALYGVVWPVLFLLIGPALVRCELVTLPPVCAWLTGWTVYVPPPQGGGILNWWTPSPGLYYLALLTRCCLLCGPMLVAQALNASALRQGGVHLKPSVTGLYWTSMGLQAADAASCLLQLLFALCKHGVSDPDAWKLPGVGDPAPALLSDAPSFAAGGGDVELAGAGLDTGGQTHSVLLQAALSEP